MGGKVLFYNTLRKSSNIEEFGVATYKCRHLFVKINTHVCLYYVSMCVYVYNYAHVHTSKKKIT